MLGKRVYQQHFIFCVVHCYLCSHTFVLLFFETISRQLRIDLYLLLKFIFLFSHGCCIDKQVKRVNLAELNVLFILHLNKAPSCKTRKKEKLDEWMFSQKKKICKR